MSICFIIKQRYEALQTLKQEFVSSCNTAVGSGSFDTLTRPQLNTLKRLKLKLETARNELKEKINIVFRVQDAMNPYREAFLVSGIPDIENSSLSKERRDITINLKETIKQQQEIYRSMGLTAWAENIATMRLRLTPDMRQTIEQEIKDGAIPIIMPDKATQLATTVEQFKTAFKPIWIKDGAEQDVNDAYMDWDHFKDLITTNAAALVEGVPDHPYISMMRPTQSPDERTTNKTVVEQQDEFVRINEERAEANQQPANITNPHEYGVLQTISSRLFKERLSEQPTAPTTLNPIDTETWTRFINLPQDSGGGVPGAYFDPGYAQAGFGGDGAGGRDARSGFRLVVRVGGI